MTAPQDLLSASDHDIEDALVYADPMVLRGLLYQLTGDEAIKATEVVQATFGFLSINMLARPEDGAMLRSKAAALLKAHRDSGSGELPFGSPERLRTSLGLTAGQEIPERDVDMWVEELALDPWARGLDWPAQPKPKKLREFEVLVIGAGMTGLNAAIQLKRAGIKYSVVEKNPDIGGTWYENRYPGSRVDTPSRGYCHIYGVDFIYPYPFSPQSENQRYVQWMADSFDARAGIQFETEAKSLAWDEAAQLWEVHLAGPEGPTVRRVNAVITAVGFLSRPSVPNFEGAENFHGEIFHTARWPEGLDITGKRVAVVGSGCSGYQAIAEIAKAASHTYLFQREPSWVYETAGYLSPYPPQVNWLERHFPHYRNFLRFRAQWLFGPETLGRAFVRDQAFNDGIREQRIAFMERKFAGRPDLMAKMMPSSAPMTSRPVLVDESYSVYDVLMDEAKATLVIDEIVRLSANGIVDATGTEHPVDIIVLATGFRANEFLFPMEIRGRGDLSLDELWQKDGARAYVGTLLPGFPNLFTLYGPNINSVSGGGNPAIQEEQTRFVLRCLAELVVHDKATVDVTRDAYDRYNAELDKAEANKIYVGAEVKNYFTNEHGRSAANCPFDVRKMWEWLRDPTGEYAQNAPGISNNADSEVRPYFGHDLIVK